MENKQYFTKAKVLAEYTQDGDCATNESINIIRIETEDCGGGNYFVIKTDRWAFDSIDEIINLINDFKRELHGK